MENKGVVHQEFNITGPLQLIIINYLEFMKKLLLSRSIFSKKIIIIREAAAAAAEWPCPTTLQNYNTFTIFTVRILLTQLVKWGQLDYLSITPLERQGLTIGGDTEAMSQ
jgi:hypothetical protein